MASDKNGPLVLGISHPNHNGAACLLRGDEIVVSVQEERLNRFKRSKIDNHLASLAAQYCLNYAGISENDLNLVVVCTMGGNLNSLDIAFSQPPVTTISHHLGHAIGAFATSGFEDAAILVVDGCGSPVSELSENERGDLKPCIYPSTCVGTPREVITIYEASGTTCTPIELHSGFNLDFQQNSRMSDFGSLGGVFNSAASQIFGNITDAGKVMGLAPYGRPRLSAEEILSVNQDGCFEFYDTIPKLFSHNARWPKHREAYEDLAYGVQQALEKGLAYLVARTRQLTCSNNLCYAGGVALNSVANGKVVYESGFDRVYIMPAAEDSGGAIGAAYHGMWTLTGENTRKHLRKDSAGREYSRSEIFGAVARTPCVELLESDKTTLDTVVDALRDGAVVGWFQGGSELGPRALGQRSILCDPRRANAKDYLNAHVKHRESFRPFAAVVLREEMQNWFESIAADVDSPFMLRVFRFKEGAEERVPAVSHIDHSCRVQTVTKEVNGILYELVKRFHEKTDVPMILNTSFNIMGEPIVESPEDALWCMLYTGIDLCVLGDTIVGKDSDYRSVLDLTPRATLANTDVTNESVSQHRRLHSGLKRTDRVTVQCVNRWGKFSMDLTGDSAAVLDAADGKRNGWDLLRILKATNGINELELTVALGELRRASCIAFG